MAEVIGKADSIYNILYSDEANSIIQYPDMESLLETPEDLLDMIRTHKDSQVKRLEVLDDYYKGFNYTINNRDGRKNGKSDHRASHNFARYIAQFIQGYMTGVPIKITSDVESTESDESKDDESKTPLLDDISEFNMDNDVDSLNSELTLDLSKFGRAYELQYRNEADEDIVKLLDVKSTFVIYDATIEQNLIGAVIYTDIPHMDDSEWVTVYTNTMKYDFILESGSFQLQNEAPHLYDEVPVIEYSNNRFRQGDYETIIPLIDLYDSSQSDTANYMTDFNDAVLAISGDIKDSAFADSEVARELLDMNILALQTGVDVNGQTKPLSAEYLTKSYDVAGTEAYKQRLEEDIHKFSNTPNMNDESFGGNVSGIAMRYKLFGLEQSRSIKERLFKKGLKKRYRLWNNLKTNVRESSYEYIGSLHFAFTANLPESIEQELEAFYQAGGKISNSTLLETLSFVDNVEDELIKIENEQAKTNETYSDLDIYGIRNRERIQEQDDE